MDLYPTVTLVCGSGQRPQKSCVHPWQPTAAMDILAKYMANQPASNKKTRNRGKRSGNNAAIAFFAHQGFAHQTLVALDGVLTSGSFDTTRRALNLAYADLLELQELACDVVLHRDTSERRNHLIFEQLSIFAKDGTSPFSSAFSQWRHRYGEWQEASARTWGICRTPTKTDFLRQTWEGSPGDPTNHHPFYSCPTAIADAQNIWILPAASDWWHDALLQLGEDITAETYADFRQASDGRDNRQGDLRWRLFRAARELKSIRGCTLTLVPPSLQEPPPDFVHTEFFLSPYIKILRDSLLGHFRPLSLHTGALPHEVGMGASRLQRPRTHGPYWQLGDRGRRALLLQVGRCLSS